MERLREQRDASDPIAVEAAKLLAELAPGEEDPARKERVRRSLAARLGQKPRRARAWVLAPAAGLIALGAMAAEYISSPPPVEAPRVESSDQNAPAIELPAEPPPSTEPDPPVETAVVKAKAKQKHIKRATVPETGQSSTAPTENEARDDETLLLVEAVRALRREHRPEAASALLEEYLRRHPDGALREEGLALAFEAAAAAKNQERALVLAREYIERYPAGQFRARAEAIVSSD